MIKNENQYKLDLQLQRSVEWVKFAEAKNGIALTLVSAVFFCILKNDFGIGHYFKTVLISILVALIGLLIYSFIPRLKWRFKRKKLEHKPNLHYFGDVANITLEEFKTQLIENYEGFECESRYFNDITCQIKINCEIALLKFLIFKIVCVILYIPLIIILISA